MQRLLALVLFTLPLVVGCSPYLMNGSARTLDRGVVQGFGAVSVPAVQSVAGVALQGGARGGVTDRFELGGAVWNFGLRLDSKLALVRPDSDQWGLNVALAPGLAAWVDGVVGGPATEADSLPRAVSIYSLQVPLLVGYRLAGHEIVLGPRVIGESDPFLGRFDARLGASLGVGFQVTRRFRIMPEVAWTSGVLGGSGDARYGAGAPFGPRWEFALAFLGGA